MGEPFTLVVKIFPPSNMSLPPSPIYTPVSPSVMAYLSGTALTTGANESLTAPNTLSTDGSPPEGAGAGAGAGLSPDTLLIRSTVA
jgi:uncharacterized spore protein YtfJ